MWQDRPTSGKGLKHTKSMSIKELIKGTQLLWYEELECMQGSMRSIAQNALQEYPKGTLI